MSDATKERWELARDQFKAAFTEAECVLVASVIRERWRISVNGRYYGMSQRTHERAWLSALRDWIN